VLDVRSDGDVVVLTLARPERRNALDTALCGAIRSAVVSAVDGGARALVITGDGSSFCAGADLSGVHDADFLDAHHGMLHHLAAVPVPVLAAVNGPAIGGGTQLALACDLRVAAPSAVFAVPTARNGLAVDAWTIRTLERVAGLGPARRLLLAAESLDAAAALACGLADRAGTLEDTIAWAHDIAALAPLSVAYSKLVLGTAADDAIAGSFAAVWASEDAAEGARARGERRSPVFGGR
jgi:enoyl-CoA hydratase